MKHRRAAIALLLCTAAAGCGGAQEAPPAHETPRLTGAERVAAAIREQAQAVARGDGESACGLFSPKALREVQALVSRHAGDIGCATAIAEGAGSLPADVLAALRHPVITKVEVHGDRATVELRVPAAVTELARGTGRARGGTPLRRIDGQWKVDAPAL